MSPWFSIDILGCLAVFEGPGRPNKNGPNSTTFRSGGNALRREVEKRGFQMFLVWSLMFTDVSKSCWYINMIWS